ncbi:MAG: GNAT family N-acetyltransferase [Oscillospiraceae bacterium]|nr:GNAT family N-acetyltransferase [Oscillospiraceae bacterium]
MEIKHQNIILRDMREGDIDDEIRWNTVQTEWALWDAPWETEEELRDFDPEQHRKKELEWIAKPKPNHRRSLEIDTADGVHLGAVSCYCIDKDCNWQETAPQTEEERQAARWAVGIDIHEPAYWGGGWGTQALAAFIRYHLNGGYADLYTQTWSGNFRMIALAEKLGFRECRRKEGIRQVRGGTYDGLTFRLDRVAFEAYWAGHGSETTAGK